MDEGKQEISLNGLLQRGQIFASRREHQPPERVKAVIEALTTAQILTDVLIEAFRLTCPPGFNRVWRELLWRKPGVDQVAFAIITVV